MGAWRGPLGVPAPSAWGWGGPLGARIGPLGMVALFARDLGGPLDAQGGPLVVLACSARGWGTLREHCKPWGHLGSLLTLWGCWYPWPWPGDPPARPPPPGLVMGHSLGWPCWGSPLLATPQHPGVPLLGWAPGAPIACSAPPWAGTPGPHGTPGALCRGVPPWQPPGEDDGVLPLEPQAEGAVMNPGGCPSLGPRGA